MIIAKVGRRGQMTLPRTIREGFNICEGDRIAFVRQGNDYVLQPLNQTLLDLRGSVPVSGPQDFESIRREVRKKHVQKRSNAAS
ncbi:MAG: AbrB/MazE/SpoVT family DNA-binding domain-containing protein [bacterium]|nr:AbrB/MazE/SpoVT family DNA-binding domain-containing protein [bacterium]